MFCVLRTKAENKANYKIIKKMNRANSFLLINYVLILFSFILLGCGNDKSKSNLSYKKNLCGDSVFVEQYIVSGGGAQGGDRVSDYVTDSINFRFYVGTFDNAHENITYECKDDSVYLEKIYRQVDGAPYNTKVVIKVLERKTIDLKFLRKQNKFD
jgi:hypothetical protein